MLVTSFLLFITKPSFLCSFRTRFSLQNHCTRKAYKKYCHFRRFCVCFVYISGIGGFSFFLFSASFSRPFRKGFFIYDGLVASNHIILRDLALISHLVRSGFVYFSLLAESAGHSSGEEHMVFPLTSSVPTVFAGIRQLTSSRPPSFLRTLTSTSPVRL